MDWYWSEITTETEVFRLLIWCFLFIGLMAAIAYLLAPDSELRPLLQLPTCTLNTAAAATKQLGLQSGVAYPVQLGRTVDGSAGTAYAYRGIFSSEVEFNIQPSSLLSINFQVDDVNYLLQIPVSLATFRQTTGESKVTFYIVGDGDKYGKVEHSNRYYWLASKCDGSFILSDETRRLGLAPIVAENLDSATIELTPEQYERILGTP